MRVTYVTGTSCAGKSTLGATLELLDGPDVVVVDVDAHAPCRPQTAWLDWLRWRAAELLHSATAHAHEGSDWLVVTGIVWPLSLIQSPAWRPAHRAGVDVEFVLLHPPWKLVHQRLAERTVERRELAELRRYNRDLRDSLYSQVTAVRQGWVLPETDVDEQLGWLLDDRRWYP